jgi:RNA polymerase sigma-70 factor (ECF subfamily)
MKEPIQLQSFNKLFTDYYPRFVSFANSYLRDTFIAEDIVNESFVSYWENRSNLNIESNIPAYILTIVKNKCLNYLKHKETQSRTLSDIQNIASWELNIHISSLEACNPQELFSKEVQSIVNKTLLSLPEKTREVFIMSRYKNKSHKEIAEALNITTKGVEFHITKALSKLRNSLKDYIFCILFLIYIYFSI